MSTKYSTIIQKIDFPDRLREACNSAEPAEIARKIGKPYQTVKNYLKGRLPEAEVLIDISNSTNVSIHWLLTGEGPKMRDSGSPMEDGLSVVFEEGVEKIIEKLAKDEGLNPSDMVMELATEALGVRGLVSTKAYDSFNYIYYGERDLRLVTVKLLGEIAAGKPLIKFDIAEEVQIPEDFIRKGRETFVLRVRGDSMKDEGIFDGDQIICVQATNAFNGETVVALIDGSEATVKKFYKRGSQIRLEPANADHDPWVGRADRVQIQGIVIGIYRRK